VVPKLNVHSRLFDSPGLRLDGGSASGSNAQVNIFPKTDVSWIAVDRPTDPLFGIVTSLRPRVAFGIAGVQPGPTEQYRLSLPQTVYPIVATGTAPPLTQLVLQTLGNTHIHPERSREVEGGADLQLWGDRVILTVTGYDKLRHDAIEQLAVAPSVLPSTQANVGNSYYANVGDIRNRGVEVSMTTRLLDSRAVQWSVNGNVSHNSNVMLHSAFGGAISRSVGVGYTTLFKPGYAIDGLWAKPILGFYDENRDEVIEPNEVRVGDSLVYVGSAQPNYELTLNTALAFLNNRLTINTSVDYQSGLTQFLGGTTLSRLQAAEQQFANPTYPPSALAALVVTDQTAIGLAQTVNTLRWQSLSVSYLVPPSISRRLRVPFLSLALQGSNLGLHTNYRGKDPNVNAFASGNYTQDTGQLPQPRLWSLSVRIGN
jgi:hypothetical protein